MLLELGRGFYLIHSIKALQNWKISVKALFYLIHSIIAKPGQRSQTQLTEGYIAKKLENCHVIHNKTTLDSISSTF